VRVPRLKMAPMTRIWTRFQTRLENILQMAKVELSWIFKDGGEGHPSSTSVMGARGSSIWVRSLVFDAIAVAFKHAKHLNFWLQVNRPTVCNLSLNIANQLKNIIGGGIAPIDNKVSVEFRNLGTP
jgi:hypothetical protein